MHAASLELIGHQTGIGRRKKNIRSTTRRVCVWNTNAVTEPKQISINSHSENVYRYICHNQKATFRCVNKSTPFWHIHSLARLPTEDDDTFFSMWIFNSTFVKHTTVLNVYTADRLTKPGRVLCIHRPPEGEFTIKLVNLYTCRMSIPHLACRLWRTNNNKRSYQIQLMCFDRLFLCILLGCLRRRCDAMRNCEALSSHWSDDPAKHVTHIFYWTPTPNA